MPRTGRLHIPGGCFHIYGRGLEKRCIFQHDVDKRDILSRFGKLLQKTNSQCLAWALMSNHYHFLIRAGASPLEKLMAPVLGGFASSYNRRHDRCGYVFQNRFASILCDERNYLLELIRYIHLNPFTAGMVDNFDELGRYPWTGHAGILGHYRQDWHSTDEVLAHFGTSKSTAIKNYLEFTHAGLDAPGRDNLSECGLVRSYCGWETISRLREDHKVRIGDERILGDSAFVERALREDELTIESRSRLNRLGCNLEWLIKAVCDHFCISESELMKKSRGNGISKAKAMICHCGTRKLGLKAREIAGRLGISQPAVSKWIGKCGEDVEVEWKRLEPDESSY